MVSVVSCSFKTTKYETRETRDGKILGHLLCSMATHSSMLGAPLDFITTEPDHKCQSSSLKINDINDT